MMPRALILIGLLVLPLAATASEYIGSFHSDIEVRRNGDIYVTETIRVRAEGKAIRRGIYRDFPTRYRNADGRNISVGFEVLSVKRDGAAEPYHIKTRANGKRVYIGDANIYLAPGFYEYEISYLTTRQLGFFDDFDELYWNVTGTGWDFAIERASALVTLPGPVADIRLTGYTGPQGSTAQNLDYRRVGSNQVSFETTQPLDRREGLTIVAAWPKGIVEAPSAAQRRAYFIQDHKPLLIAAAGAGALLIFYGLMWLRVGRDPEAGVIIPRYRAPSGYSPASMRFIDRMGYDKKCFTTALVNMAVEGAVEIENTGNRFFVRKSGRSDIKLAPGERQVMQQLFSGGRSVFAIEQKQHRSLAKAIRAHKKSLGNNYEKIYFVTNRWLLIPGVLLTLTTAGISIASIETFEQIVQTLFVGLFSLVPLLMLFALARGFRMKGAAGLIQVAANGAGLAGIFIFVSIYRIPVLQFADRVSWPLVGTIIFMLGLNYAFERWLRAPTKAGRRLLDRIDGFRHYLAVAEEDEIALKNAPTFTTDLYEAYLPYAIALDLENEWTARLDRAVATGLVDRGYTRPRWYHSSSRGGKHFSNLLSSSLNTAIAASSVAPGSSSGSSGGSSGGGGGGGGGGGW